jgi:hypothetical protein
MAKEDVLFIPFVRASAGRGPFGLTIYPNRTIGIKRRKNVPELTEANFIPAKKLKKSKGTKSGGEIRGKQSTLQKSS